MSYYEYLPEIDTKKVDTLYHYTSTEGFYSIIDTKSIRISDIKYLNDSSEYLHGCKILNEIIDKEITGSDQFIDDLKEEIKRSIGLGNALKRRFNFVFSLSRKPNKLSQWRAYTGNGGVSIGFNIPHFESIYSTCGDFKLVKCIYGEEKQKSLIKDMLIEFFNGIEERFNKRNLEDSNCKRAVSAFIDFLEILLSAFKDEAFYEEEEYRLIDSSAIQYFSNKNQLYKERVKFRPKDGILVPYFHLVLEYKEIIQLKDVIKEIWMGPSKNKDLFEASLKDFVFKNISPDCKIEVSEIPYIIQ